MRPIIIDTNAYVAFQKGSSLVLDLIQCAQIIMISPIVIGELLAGFEGGNKPKQNRLELQQFLDSERIKIQPITSETAQFFAQIHLQLKRKGKPIPTNDIWIAAQALEQGALICSFDQHFTYIDGLLLVTSIADLSF